MKTGLMRLFGVWGVGVSLTFACSDGSSTRKATVVGTVVATTSPLDVANAMPAIRERLEARDDIEAHKDAFILTSIASRPSAGSPLRNAFSISAPRSLSKALHLSRDSDAETWLEVRALGMRDAAQGAIERGSIVYRAADTDLDVVLSLGGSRLEELRVLRSPKAVSTAHYSLSVSPGMQVRELDGRIEALDATGRVAFRTNAAFAVDSAGTKRSVQFRLEGSELTASFDATSLKYPVVVDPEWVAGPTWPREAVVAQNSAELSSGSGVVGDVAVIERNSGTFLGSLAPAQLESGAQLTGSLSADSVRVQSGSVVTGDVHFNSLSGTGAIQGERFRTLSLPVPVSVPNFPAFTPGTQDITTSSGAPLQLAAGNYRNLTLKSGTTLRLTGGAYAFSSILFGSGSRFECLAACDVRLAGRFLETSGSFFGPAADASIGPDGVEVFVSATNGSSSLTAQPAASFSSGSAVRARFFVPNGTVSVADGVQVVGILIARDVLLSTGAQLVKDAATPPSCTANDNNPCTQDSCSAAGQPVFTPLTAGASCADANVCNGSETCNGVGACAPGVPLVVDDGNPCTTDTCDSTAGVKHSPVAAGTSCTDGNACNGAELCNGTGLCGAGTPPVLDDGNPCTTDACDPTAGVTHSPLATGTSCSDGNACNGAETCNGSGACTAGTPPALDDGNPCTTDSCDPTQGILHTAVAAGTSCSDGNACNGSELCNGSGICAAGSAPTLDDGNPCTADTCDPSLGVVHLPLANGTSCADGNLCNGNELCQSGLCTSGTAPVLDDGNPCTADACDPIGGVTHVPVSDGTSCSDGNACNGLEMCAHGTCAAGSPPTIDDGNPCTADSCDARTGVHHTPVAAGTSCSDGNACNGSETCSGSGTCTAGTPPVVDDGNPCTADACDPGTGVTHTALPAGTSCSDGNACNGAELCTGAGACAAGAPPSVDDGNSCTSDSCDPATGVHHTPLAAGTSCSDGNACNGSEACDGSGICSAGTAPVMDDGNPCTSDSCDPKTGVQHTPVATGTSCSDGNACNGSETCGGSGTCVAGTPPVVDDRNPCTTDACDPTAGVTHTSLPSGTSCSDGNACNGAELCTAAGACAAGTPPTVDDGNPCTADSCDPAIGVKHAPVATNTSCSDGNACNGNELCDGSGTCASGTPPIVDDGNPCTADSCDATTGVKHTPLAHGASCSDGNVCNGSETCNGAGVCTAGTALVVDDGNVCSADFCDPASGVSHTPTAAGSSCADANLCNGTELCDGAGKCAAGTPLVVDDGNPCTADSCNPTTGVTHTAVAAGTSCSDANVCNGAERCDNTGTCAAGTPLTIDDGNTCTADSCDPIAGVKHTPASDGTSCSDGNACNGSETCQSGACAAGAPPILDDSNPCTADSCEPTLGVVHAPVAFGTSCSDGNPCNGAEVCSGFGQCAAGTPASVDDGNPCTADACDPIAGITHVPVAAGLSCDDGNACNGQERCDAIGTCASGTALAVDDGDPCTADACDPVLGVSHTPIPGCAGGTPGQPFETRASIMGRVINADSSPVTVFTAKVFNDRLDSIQRSDVVVTVNPDGTFRIRLSEFPQSVAAQTPPQHVLVQIESDAFPTLLRSTYVRPGEVAALGDLVVLQRDPTVTVIGPEGGTAQDSQGTLQLQIPAGALSQPTPVRLTPIPTRAQFPAPLPSNTVTMYGMEIEPSGTVLSIPATLRVKNTLNLPNTMRIPVGTVDPRFGDWTHEGFAIWDGSRFATTISHFSPHDCNGPRLGELVEVVTESSGRNKNKSKGCVGSSVSYANGALDQSFDVPLQSAAGHDYSLSLNYTSELSGSITVGQGPPKNLPIPKQALVRSFLTQGIRLACLPPGGGGCSGSGGGGGGPPCLIGSSGAGVTVAAYGLSQRVKLLNFDVDESQSQPANAQNIEPAYYVPIPDDSDGNPVRSGYLPAHITSNIAVQGSGTCVAGGAGFQISANFGSVPPTRLPVSAVSTGDLLDFPTYQLVVHRRGSPMGSGWAFSELGTLYRAPDGVSADIVHGDGEQESFHPYPSSAKILDFNNASSNSLAVDLQTGEVFSARDGAGIQRLDLRAGVPNPLFSGSLFGGLTPLDFKVTYVGGARRFLATTRTGLFEIGTDGSTRTLSSFVSGPFTRIPTVAGVGKYAYFAVDEQSTAGGGTADVVTVSRIDLTDPNRTIVVMTPPANGDLNLDPHGEVQAQNFQFLHPSGLAPAFDGGLYVADDRRHAVYHLAPNDAGEVGADSLVTRVLGSGVDSMVGGLGRKMPALETALRQPGPLALAPDGILYVRGDAFLGGLLAFDPVEKTAHWVAFDKSARVSATDPLSTLATLSFRDDSLAPLPGEKVIVPQSGLAFQVTTQLTSEYRPLRTLTFSDTGASVVDTDANKIEQYSWTSVNKNEGTLTSESLRSGEPIRSISYKDPDRVDFIQDAAGGRVTFAYDGSGHLSSVTDSAQRTTHFTVDSDGNLREVIYPSGEARRFEYQDFRMTSSTHPDGEVSTYDYAPDGTLKTAHRPGGGTTTVQAGVSRGPKFDSAGRIFYESLVTDDRGVQHALSTNAAGAVIADKYTADGQTYDVENVYAPLLGDAANLDAVTNRYLRFSNTTINGLPFGPVIKFDRLGRAISVTQSPTDSTFKYGASFDGTDRLTHLAFGAGGIDWAYTYDSAGHLIKSADVSNGSGTLFPETGRRTTYSGFRPQDGQPTTVTAHSTPTTLGYDSFGLINSAVDTVGRSLTTTHDAAGNTLTVNDGTTTLQYGHDPAGRVTSIADADGNTTTLDYQTAGCSCSNGNRVTALVTPDLASGQKWAMAYDPDGDLQSTTTPLGELETYAHNAQRDLIGVTDRAGRPTAFTYDQLGRRATITDPIGRVGVFAYSLPTASSWSGPTLYAQSQNATPAPVSLTASLGDGQYQVGTNGFQPGGDRSHVTLYRDATFQSSQWLATDRLDRVQTRADRSALGLPFSSTTPGPFHSGTIPFQDEFHDYTGPLSLFHIQETSEGTSRSWGTTLVRNPELEVTSFDSFLGIGLLNFTADTTVSHDPAGRLTGVVTQNASSGISYLRNGQVDQRNQSTPLVQNDSIGDLCITDDTCPTLHCVGAVLDDKGGVITYGHCVVYFLAATTQAESFQYDSRGLVKKRTLTVVPNNRFFRTTEGGDFEYGYDPVGRNVSLIYPDGHERNQVFDALGRLTSRCYIYHDGSATHCYTATYDSVGNPKVLTDPDMRSEIEYDDLDRVTEVRRYVPPTATVAAYVESYAYNALGGFSIYDGAVVDDHRPRLDGAGKASAGIPASFAGQPITLDGGGRVTAFNGQTLQYYSYDHHLESLTNGTQKQTFVYDALERPIGIHSGPVSGTPPARDENYFYSDFSGSLTAIIGTAFNAHVPPEEPSLPNTSLSVGYDGVDHPLWLAEGPHMIYPELDAIGNVRHAHAGVDPANPTFTGDLGGYSYSAFGKTLGNSDPGGIVAPPSTSLPFQWQGKRLIGTNLYDSRARVWSADLGAFLQPDEYGFLTRGGTLWSWPGQNPIKYRDQSGRGNPAEDLAGEFLDAASEFSPVAGGAANDNSVGAAASEEAAGLSPAGAALLAAASLGVFADQVHSLADEIFAQQDANANAIARAAARARAAAGGAGEPPDGPDCGGWSERRVAELGRSIPEGQKGRITMAAGMAQDPVTGEYVRIIGTSEPNGYLRPGVTLQPGEVLASGTGHAEADIAAYAAANGLDLVEIAATRPICPSCMQATYNAGGVPLGPLKLP